ncbi:hypothetical protein LB456_10730 [Psychroflexus sp. CAK57W]|uniref:hypothetical protein n=1 Tax=Psychroflexus curvus TaxID=2873595 RepID=UPI001CCCDB8D|nr:hypothetical protein [Psychroflexus curvus]MBZ9628623.1 hypothetical protein [Psychroflexus curvus]MBZ9787931.1 hypothetical protein [Psychroflexus curvus]
MLQINTILFFLLCVAIGNAQEKNEVEKRVKKGEVHERAIEWLNDAFEKKRKTKWYLQTDGEKEVFEAKLKHKNHLHSVEFDLDGNVRNVEVLIDENELEREVLKVILTYLKANYTKFSISKIQIQYTGEGENLEDVIDEDEFEDITINYEIEFYGKSDTEDELWEGLFDAKGTFLEKRVINLKATDNLDY